MVTAIPGLLNLLIWCTGGMEGNIMGFLFFGPMLIAAAINLCMWIFALVNSRQTAAFDVVPMVVDDGIEVS